jgi:uncharacterized protein (TIGR00725 family)
MKVAIFGSASKKVSKQNKVLCERLSKYLVSKKITVVTGASTGIPGLITQFTKSFGGKTIGYSPDKDEISHKKRFDNLDLKHFSVIMHHNGFTERSIKMIKDVDFAIVINGRMGTLSEFAVAVEEGLGILVLENTGGIAKHLKIILKLTKKKSLSKVVFTDDYKNGIKLKL